MADETPPSRPRIDRYDVAVNVFVFVCATSAMCLYFFGTGHHYWDNVSLIFQIALAGMSGYRLFRIARNRRTRA